MIIAIDGPAGVGKSSVAEKIAHRLSLFFINSGNFYRAVTKLVIDRGIDPDDAEAVAAAAEGISLTIEHGRLHCSGTDVQDELHTDQIDAYVAEHSAIRAVRDIVNSQLRKVARNLDVISEGRDITTVVFPHADYKFYLDADINIRAQRRYSQQDTELSLQEIKNNLEKRDYVDKNKEYGKLAAAPDAVYIDTSYLTLDEVYEKVLQKINQNGKHMQESRKVISEKETEKADAAAENMTSEEFQKDPQEQLREQEQPEQETQDTHQDVQEELQKEQQLSADEHQTQKQDQDQEVQKQQSEKAGQQKETAADASGSDQNTVQNELQEEYLKSLDDIEEGQLVTGQVIEVADDFVFVDVGFKSEGKIPVEEFEELPESGDEVQVVLVSKEGKNGQTVVSKRKADSRLAAIEMKEAYNNEKPIKGTFFRQIKGGYEVSIYGSLKAFCPLSKADIRRVENPEDMIGVTDYFIIDKMNTDPRVKPVLSRRAYLEREIERRKQEFFSEKQIGDVVTGTVKSFTSFGAFIDLGGFDGLLHINDMSWGHVTRPKDYVRKGQEIELKLILLDPESQKINLSLKHFTQDPWETFGDRYTTEDIVTGKVTKLTDFGVFIEIEEGIEGLAHISELSWVKRISHPREVVSVGDEVEAMILGFDIEQRKVSLGLKQVTPNPWDSIAEKYPEGMQMRKTVVKVTNAGAFLELEEGIDGFLHSDDVSWTHRPKNMKNFCSEGDDLDVVVTRVDSENRRIRLGVKQLSDNPWKSLKDNYRKGSVIEGVVSGITDFGVFVKVVGDIEGLISKYNLIDPNEEYTDDVLDRFSMGDKVKAVVLDVNPSAKKLALSIKEYIRQNQRKEISKYIHEDDEDSSDTFTMADLFNEKKESDS